MSGTTTPITITPSDQRLYLVGQALSSIQNVTTVTRANLLDLQQKVLALPANPSPDNPALVAIKNNAVYIALQDSSYAFAADASATILRDFFSHFTIDSQPNAIVNQSATTGLQVIRTTDNFTGQSVMFTAGAIPFGEFVANGFFETNRWGTPLTQSKALADVLNQWYAEGINIDVMSGNSLGNAVNLAALANSSMAPSTIYGFGGYQNSNWGLSRPASQGIGAWGMPNGFSSVAELQQFLSNVATDNNLSGVRIINYVNGNDWVPDFRSHVVGAQVAISNGSWLQGPFSPEIIKPISGLLDHIIPSYWESLSQASNSTPRRIGYPGALPVQNMGPTTTANLETVTSAPPILPTGWMPSTGPLTYADAQTVLIKPGDTLSKIAADQNKSGNSITSDDLMKINGLSPGQELKLQIGQQILG